MIKHKMKFCITIIGILLVVIILVIMQPFIFRNRTIETLARIELPNTAEIIEYRVGVNPFTTIHGVWGVSRLYAKVRIDRDTFEAWTRNRTNSSTVLFDRVMVFRDEHKSLNIEEIEEIWIADIMGGRSNFLSGTTGIVYTIITKEAEGQYYFYVVYR